MMTQDQIQEWIESYDEVIDRQLIFHASAGQAEYILTIAKDGNIYELYETHTIERCKGENPKYTSEKVRTWGDPTIISHGHQLKLDLIFDK